MWIKDIKGDIINTRHIQSIVYNEAINGSEVLCTLELAGQILQATTFEGTEEECKEYMDKLMRDLNGELSYEEQYESQLMKERAFAQHAALTGGGI
jgi:hypothetical protein